MSSEDDVKQAFEWIKKNIGVVQILINNAGLAVLGNFAGKNYILYIFIFYLISIIFNYFFEILDTDLAVSKNILNINLFGTINCTKEALTVMKESKLEGHIININRLVKVKLYLLNEKRTQALIIFNIFLVFKAIGFIVLGNWVSILIQHQNMQ